MSERSATAVRWFVPNEIFERSIEDYAFVGRPRKTVERAYLTKNWGNNTYDHFSDFLSQQKKGQYLELLGESQHGTLIFSDVDQSSSHRDQIYNVLESERLLGEMNPGYDAALRRTPPTHPAIRVLSREQLSSKYIDYVIGFNTPEEKDSTLKYVSQHRRIPSLRPVMMLLHLVDARQSTATTIVRGWATAYDFVEDLIHVKPFAAKKGHHPLGDKWTGSGVTLDGHVKGLLFNNTVHGSPAMFAKDIINTSHKNQTTTSEWYRISVYCLIGEWILTHWAALSTVSGANHGQLLTQDLKEDLRKALGLLLARSAQVKVPTEVEVINQEPQPDMEGFKMIEEALEDREENYRYDAVVLRNRGKVEEANNAAKVYGQLLDLLYRFGKDPKADF